MRIPPGRGLNDASPVIVAGGGIAGLSAGVALAQAGRRAVVVEREPEAAQEGAGLQLSPNSSRHLRDWGVLDDLGGAALAPEAVVIRRARDARTIVQMPLDAAERRWGAPYQVAHRADLMRVLLARAEDLGVVLRRGAAVTGWREEGRRLVVSLSDGSAIEGLALVIADGVHSALRGALLGPADPPAAPSGRMAWRSLAPAASAPDFARQARSNLWLGPRAHLVHYPLRSGEVVNIVAIVDGGGTDDPGQDLWSRPGEGSVLLERFADWHEDARALLRAAPDWRVWPLLRRPVPRRLAEGRVALAGDAAHPMMPFLAQGAAQAIEDAAALGDAFRAHDDPVRALAAYDVRRRTRAARIVGASARQGRIYHLRGPAAWARDAAMRVIGPAGMMRATDWIYCG